MSNWSEFHLPRQWEMGRAYFLYLQSTDPRFLESLIRTYGPPRIRVKAVTEAA